MKKLSLLLLGCIFAISVSAQTDSVKKTATKPVYKVRMIGGAQMSSANDLMVNLSRSKNHTIFVSLINAAGMAPVLKGNNLTVFAPTDDAFKLKPGFADTLLKPAHLADLTKAINSFIIPAKLTSADMAKQIVANHGQAIIKTLSGSTFTAAINPNRNIILTDDSSNRAIVTQFDIAQANGVLHVINNVLISR